MNKKLKAFILNGSSIDADAQAFFTAAAITDATQKSAINTLVIALKAAGVWIKRGAIYPFVGGAATPHTFNLKNPAAFQITWNGGITHSSNGVLFNGSTGYGATGLVPSVDISGACGLSYYSRTNGNTGADQIDIGTTDSVVSFWVSAWYNASGLNNVVSRNQSLLVLLDGGVVSSSQGLYSSEKVGTTSKLLKNGVSLDSQTDTAATSSKQVYIGAINNTDVAPLFFTNRQCAYASIGQGLTVAEALAEYNAVQAFQTTLGRQV